MTFINFIWNIFEENESFPYNLQFVIDDKELSFIKVINIIFSNKKLIIHYKIVSTNVEKVPILNEKKNII